MEPSRQFKDVPTETLNGWRMKTSGLDEDRVTALASHIREHGFPGSVQVEQTRTGPLMTDGHHRLAAATRVGLSSVPVREYANTPEGRTAANRAMASAEAEKEVSHG